MRSDVREEWDGTKQHDVLFLLSIDPPDSEQLEQIRKDTEASKGPEAKPSPDLLYGLIRVRGCEVIEVRKAWHFLLSFGFRLSAHTPKTLKCLWTVIALMLRFSLVDNENSAIVYIMMSSPNTFQVSVRLCFGGKTEGSGIWSLNGQALLLMFSTDNFYHQPGNIPF